MLRTNITLFFILAFGIHAFSQTSQYPNTVYPDSTLSFGTCPFDSTKQIWMYQGFKVYQTQNNMPDGAIDSNYCIGMGKRINQHYYVDGKASAAGRPIFITWNPTAAIAGHRIDSHIVIEANTYISSKRENHFSDSSSCAYGDCLSVKGSIRKRVTIDSHYVETIESPVDWVGSGSNGTYASLTTNCHPSEKYDSIAYDSLIVTILLSAADSFWFSHSLTTFEYGVNLVDTAEIIEAHIDSNKYQFHSTFNGSNHLFPHYVPGVPSNSNVAYFDFAPIPNQDSAGTVDIEFTSNTTVNMESFVQFRGGLPILDSNRHTLNIINNGADHCIYPWFERVFGKNTNLIHKQGGIYPEENACVMFNSGSNLIIDTDSKLFYGYEGKGMLAIKPESHIKLRPGSLLSLSTMVVLLDDAQSDQYRYRIDIPKGAKLEFRENSKISTQFCSNSDTKIEIFMLGGELDLSGLDEDSKQKVIVRFPAISNPLPTSLDLQGNPVQDDLLIKVNAQYDNAMALLIYSIDGTLVNRSEHTLFAGTNQFRIDVGHLGSGAYIIKAENRASVRGLKMIKL
jgi:hypothetical protein